MKKKKTIFHLLNHDQTIKITEDNENNGFKYYIEHRKYKNTHTHTPLHASWAMPITHSMVTLTKMIN